MPTPKWKLVVDVGSAPPKPEGKALDTRIPDMLKLLAENIPTHRNSPFSPYLPGFTALRLLLLKRNKTAEEDDLASTMLDSYSSYLSSGRNSSETAWMVARDYMLLTQTTSQHSTIMPQTLQSMNQQQQIVQHHDSSTHQQQLGQVHQVPNMQQQQQQQHNIVPAAQQTQQVHSNQFQQMEAIQKASQQQMHRTVTHPGQMQHQQNQVITAVAPVLIASAGPAVQHTSYNNNTHGQDALSTLGHFATHATPNGQNGISQNGIAALSHLAQQHQMAHTNGISSLQVQKDKNGVPGA